MCQLNNPNVAGTALAIVRHMDELHHGKDGARSGTFFAI